MKSRKTLVIVGVVILAAVLIIAMMAGGRGPKAEIVKTTTVSKGNLKSYLSTNAVVQSKKTKSYIGASQLQVSRVNVEVGDKVKAGEVMVEYDLSDLETSVDQAGIQYSNAVLQRKELVEQKNQLDDKIDELDRQIKELEDSLNPADAVQLQTLKQKRESIQPISDEKIKLMDNSVSLAKLTLDSAKSKLEKYQDGIVAEFGGTVTALSAVEGSVLNPAQPAVVVQQLDNLKAVMSLGKYDALKVKVDQKVILKNGDKTYDGVVSFINPAAAKTASLGGQETSLQAEIDILDESPELKVDFDVNVDILLGSAKNAVKLPIECLKYDKSGKSFVFKVEDGKAKQAEVKPGLQSDTETQIKEGVSVGEAIIMNPAEDIEDGTLVKLDEGDKK